MKKFEEFIKEEACATLGNTGGMGAIVSAQPSATPGDSQGGSIGSGDIGQTLGTYSKPAINLKKKKNKKRRKLESFGDFMNEDSEIDNFTARYYDNYDDEEEPSYEVNMEDITTNNIKKIQMYEKNIIDDILSSNEGIGDWWDKFINYGKKGILTAAILLSVAFSAQAQQSGKSQEVIKTGIEMMKDNEQKIDVYSFFVGVASESMSTCMRNGDIDGAGAFKQIVQYYENLRDNKTPVRLENNIKKYLKNIENITKGLSQSEILHFIQSGKTFKSI